MKRRDFIRLSGAAGLGAATGGLSGCAVESRVPDEAQAVVTPTVCEICFWRCAGYAYVHDGRPWKVVGHPDDLHSGGRLCTRGTGGPGAWDDPSRLRQPLIREGKPGQQRFRPATWDEALGYVAERMQRIAKEHGPERLALFSHGSGGAFFRHLLKAYGADTYAAPSFAQCRGPRDVGFRLTFGEPIGSPDRTDMAASRCIVLIGSHLGENLHNGQVQDFTTALARGASVITVDPRFSVAASKSKYWLPIKPGTDLALLLAWMHVIVGEERYDRDYVARYCHGFAELAAHVRPFTPEWAWLETGIEPERIRETAREMARHAPATLVHPGRHVTWYGDDTQRTRAIAILSALLGSWGRPGGYYAQERVNLPEYPTPPYPKSKGSDPKARRGDFPFADADVTNAIIDASVGASPYYRGWIVYGTNLPMTIPGIAAKLQEASQKLELFVVVDVQPAEVTGYADVILPECSYLERYDELRNAPEREPSLALRMPALAPRYETKPAWWMTRELGHRLGLGAWFPWQDYTEVLDWQLKQVGSSLEEMQRIGLKRFPRKTPMYFAAGEAVRFRTPTGKVELYSTELAKAGHDPLPRYTPPDEAPAGFLRLVYGRAPAHTFGRTTNNPLLFQLMPENTVWVHPDAARPMALASGRYVRLKNQDGVVSLPVRVRVTERIRPDCVFLVHGFGHTAKGLQLTQGIGADDTGLMTRVKVDPLMGGTGMRANFVTLLAEGTPA
ncbi:MAG: molybdopterin-dependent oxidoreductase [Gammaproteobacteria bacterium]|nr:molybdopterin-dependent oxidoreductase [Gammaproteobacteria bacterium]